MGVRRGWISEDHPVRAGDFGWAVRLPATPAAPKERQRTFSPGNSHPERAQPKKQVLQQPLASEKLEAIEAIVPPRLRKGTFRPTDALLAWLKAPR